MDLKDRLYQATNCGLDIILTYYPQAREAVDSGKHFRLRDERTPSASVKLIKGRYMVTDFGGDGRAMDALAIVQREEGIGFPEALHLMASRFGVSDDQIHESNRPDIRKRPAAPEEEDGSIFFETEETVTPEQLRILGPRVTQADCDTLHWHVARSVSTVRNREVTTKLTTPTYPIFIRDCAVEGSDGQITTFYKIYEPLNPDKGFRFMYAPRGAKPQGYINGLYELKAQYDRLNDTKRKEWEADPFNQGREYQDEKLPEVFICSGERDALCVRSMGFWPVWFNSETADIRREDMDLLQRYAATVYNIPDIDATGRRQGTSLALQYINMKTVWLPADLLSFRDSRGRPRKDLRDWCELHPDREAFTSLLDLSMPARFWTSWRNEKTGRWQHAIEPSRMLYFLELNGFRRLLDEHSRQQRLVRIDGYVIHEIEPTDITDFLIDYSRDYRHPLPEDVRSLMLKSECLSPAQYSRLPVQSFDLSVNSGRDFQYYFFSNCSVRVTADGLDTHPADRRQHYTFEDRVIPHRLRPLPPMFTVTWQAGPDGDTLWDIDIPDIDACGSCSLKVAVNTSRLHWRKGWEQVFFDDAERRAWHEAHRFDIADPALSEEEVREQKKTLISKLYAIGYLLHRYKDRSRPWAPIAMDNRLGTLGESNGGSGKSFFFEAMKVFQSVEVMNGKEPRLLENRHALERVSSHSDLVYVDDCAQGFDLEQFFNMITGDMVINPKNNRSFTLPFDISPKLAFSTNYVPRRFDQSSERRSLYVIFGDWYHERGQDSDYRENHSIADDFGRQIMGAEYTPDDWNWDLNFYLQCLQFYLRCKAEGLKPLPYLANIIRRSNQANMGANFESWALVFFDPAGTNVNCRVSRREAFEDFCSSTRQRLWTMQKFSSALRSFADNYSYRYELNPTDICGRDGRIIGRDPASGRTAEYLYMRTLAAETAGDPGTAGTDDASAAAPDSPDSGQAPVEEPLPF